MIGILGCGLLIAAICVSAAAAAVSAGVGIAGAVQAAEQAEQAEEMEDLQIAASNKQKVDAKHSKRQRLDLAARNSQRMQAEVGASIALNHIAAKRAKVKQARDRAGLSDTTNIPTTARTARPNGTPAAS